ncbi:gamma carbonic anhydrase family protein [Microbaculum sp. FT89]|uniref:gamma carbonic anhydrase family protein n=1 Tax=Microbaculum sp. FT89 TaxID=3447298 RepID=UPI003F52F6FE
MTVYSLDGVGPDLPQDGRYWIAPNASVMGKVRLKADASVWFGAVLRGDNEWIEVGERSNVQDGCVLHTDMGFPLTIADDCTIGHMAILHGCTIGPCSLVGMGATVLNGVRVGENCLIGANALVPEGREIPNGSLVLGSPAKIVRVLTEAEIAGLKVSAQHYADNARRYAAGLKEI